MKILRQFALTGSVLVMLFTAMSLSSCKSKSDPAPTPVERVTKILTDNGGSWAMSATGGVLVDGVDVTQELFPGFSIAFGEGTLTTTGTSPVWERQDTWRFKDESATVIIRGQDDKEVLIQEVSESTLTLVLEWDKETYQESGRTRSIIGTYTFSLKK